MDDNKKQTNQSVRNNQQPKNKVVSSVVCSQDEDTTNFVNILRRAKETMNVESDTSFAKQMGLRQSSISTAKARGKFPYTWAVQIAKETGVSLDWLIFGRQRNEVQTGAGEAEVAGPIIKHLYNEMEQQPELIMVPKVKAKLNAGGGSLITSDEIVGRFAFRNDWIRLKGHPDQMDQMVLMDVFGESMEPVIWDGDTVLIDQHQTELTPGRIYAVGIEGSVVVKYVDMKPGALVLRSANPRWEDIEIECQGDLEECVKIIGRVIWWCREAR